MNVLSQNEFDKLYKNNSLNGLFLFITSDCVTCKMAIDKLKQSQIIFGYKIIDCIGHITYYMDDHKLDDMPTMRVYKDNEVLYQKSGILFPRQQLEIKEFIHKTFGL